MRDQTTETHGMLSSPTRAAARRARLAVLAGAWLAALIFHPQVTPTAWADTLTLRPNGAGFYTAWGEVNGACTLHWDCVDEATADEDSTAVHDNTWSGTERDTYVHPASGLAGGTSIAKVEVFVRARRNTGEDNRIRVLIRSGSTDAESATIALTTSYADYSQTWTDDPATGLQWTVSGVDNVQIGARNAMTSSSTGGVLFTQSWMVVTYAGPEMDSVILRPNTAGSYAEWDAACSSNHWECVDEAVSDGDTTSVSDNTWNGTEREAYQLTDSGISTGSPIEWIEVFVNARKNTADDNRIRNFIHPSLLTDAESGAHALTQTYADYTKIWLTDPSTGAAWTIAGVDGLQAGARNAMSGGGPGGVNFSQVWVVVRYRGAPSITSFSDSPDPAQVGQTVTFAIDWNDKAGEQVKAHVCRTNAITASTSGGSCPGGAYVSSASLTTTDPINLTYVIQDTDEWPLPYYVFACDDSSLCSPASGNSGEVTMTGTVPWYDTNWLYRQKLTVRGNMVSTPDWLFASGADVTNIPVYVNLADLSTGFFSHVKADGSDIVVTKANGKTKLSRQLVSINTGASTGELWFKAPTLYRLRNTDFYIYYGNAAAAETNSAGVWTAYRLVQHLNDLTTSTTDDSSAWNNDGTKTAANEPVEAAGPVGRAQSLDGVNDAIRLTEPPQSSTNLTGGSLFAWIKTSNAGSSYRGIAVKQNAYGMYLKDNVFIIYDFTAGDRSTGINLADGLWHHVGFTFDSGTANGTILYIDGIARLTTTMTISNQNEGFIIGAGDNPGTQQLFAGSIDEVQLYPLIFSGDWIKTSYNNQSNPTKFYFVGGEQPLNPQTTLENLTLEKATVNDK